MGSRKRSRVLLWIGTATLLAATSGCQPAVMTYPHCPVPVLISKVNRVHTKTPAPMNRAGVYDTLSASSGYSAAASSSTSKSHNGNTTTTTTTTTSSYESAGPLSLTTEVLRLVPNRNDALGSEIQLDGVWTGDFIFISPGGFINQVWSDPKGRKLLVP